MAIYTLGPLVGPVVGPIAGGFIAQTIGVKYVFVVIAGVSTLAACIGVPFLRETYAPIIRLRKALKVGDEEALRRIPNLEAVYGDKKQFLQQNLTRPIIMLTRSFICFILSLYMAL
jgi:MFS family permease